MAKFKFIEKFKKNDALPTDVTQSTTDVTEPVDIAETLEKLANEEESKKEKKKLAIPNFVWDVSADVINLVDEIINESSEIVEDGLKGSFTVGAAVVNLFDRTSAFVEWFLTKMAVFAGRKFHDIHITISKNKKTIIKNLSVLGAGALLMVIIFAWATDYEYSYHGRPLGIVEEQRDVIEILELASEELSKEYGTNIQIDAEEDISFRVVTSYGKEVDNQDKVLQKLTYMGELNAEACAIVADGKTLVIVENKDVAKAVLEDIKSIFVTDSDSVEYEYIGFAEKITLESCSVELKNISGRAAAVNKLRSGGQQATDYIVKDGDTVYGICEKLGLSLSELEALNPNLDVTLIHAGDALKVEREIPLVTIETVAVVTYAESIPYKTEYEKSSYYFEGEKVVRRAGTKGKASVVARQTKQNGEIIDSVELKRETIIEPVSKIVVKGTKPTPPKHGTGSYLRPVNVGIYAHYGWRWGRMHEGVDLAAPTGTPIRAADGGTVVKAGWAGAYGLRITIDHGNGVKTIYAHNSANYVSVGDRVFQGQTIGAVGNTGRSTGPHCHFEIRINGRAVNPSYYI